MTLYAGTIPPELLKLAVDIRGDIEAAKGHIEACNYGIAQSWLNGALEKLPIDGNMGQTLDWPELERRTT